MWNLPALRNSSSLASPLLVYDIPPIARDVISSPPMPARGPSLLGASQFLSDYLIDFQSALSELRNRSGRILLHET